MCVKVVHISHTVLKTGPDRPIRPVQSRIESHSGPVKTLKTGQQPIKNRKTGQNREKTGVKPEIKKNGLMSGSVFKTMISHVPS